MPSRDQFIQLRNSAPVVLPSMLQCDFGNLAREVEMLEAAGCRALHLDVMDGIFVPNLTYGMPIVAAIRRLTDLPLDVHLMIERPERYLRQFSEAGANVITVHAEAVDSLQETLEEIRSLDVGAGLALNPDTPLERILEYLPLCDLVLVMSVAAGFGGQQFQSAALTKLQALSGVSDRHFVLEVDGGVNPNTIRQCAEAGAEMFVVGSAIFQSNEYGQVVDDLTRLAAV